MAGQGASLSLPLVTAVFTQAVDPVVFTAFQWQNTFNIYLSCWLFTHRPQALGRTWQ